MSKRDWQSEHQSFYPYWQKVLWHKHQRRAFWQDWQCPLMTHNTNRTKGQSALTTLDLPVVSNVLDANLDKPYLSLRIELDVMLLRKLDEQTAWQTTSPSLSDSLSVFDADENLLNAILRLVKLLDNPKMSRHLAPFIEQEITLYILSSPICRC